jgi:hypothetical protein
MAVTPKPVRKVKKFLEQAGRHGLKKLEKQEPEKKTQRKMIDRSMEKSGRSKKYDTQGAREILKAIKENKIGGTKRARM